MFHAADKFVQPSCIVYGTFWQQKEGVSVKSDGHLCPRLVKLVENPLLSETLDYVVREGRQVVGHWAPDATADIMLRGSLIAESHWSVVLAVMFRIMYDVICKKMCPGLCVFDCNCAANLCSPVSESANRGHLCLAARGDLAVPRSRTTRYGQRCFAVSGPILWNSLPLSVRDPSLTLTQFCARLKTVSFCRAYETLA